MFKEWAKKHRGLMICLCFIMGIVLGFLQPILLHSNDIFKQGMPFGLLYSSVLIATEISFGGKQ